MFEKGISTFHPQKYEIGFPNFSVYIIYYMYKRITVGLSNHIYNRLKDKGKFGESFSDLINRLLTEIDTIKEK